MIGAAREGEVPRFFDFLNVITESAVPRDHSFGLISEPRLIRRWNSGHDISCARSGPGTAAARKRSFKPAICCGSTFIIHPGS